MTASDTLLLQMEDIEKSFYGVKVLDNVSIDLYMGKCWRCWGKTARVNHAHQNPDGDYQKDGGTILIDGQPVHINQPRDAAALGIRMIYQEQHYAAELR